MRAGYIAIIGRPNVGKSTLLNFLLGKKISITSRKPQTTQQRILGVKTKGDAQFIFLDTPGFCIGKSRVDHRPLKRAIRNAIEEADLILMVVDAQRWTLEDQFVLKRLRESAVPLILVVNKIDRIADKKALLPFIEKAASFHVFSAIVPIAAKNGTQLPHLEQVITERLPLQPHLFPPEYLTDSSDNFLVTELIREKLMRELGQELPFSVKVTIDSWEQERILKIAATIWVAKASQKPIVIGEAGSKLKSVGQKARLDIEKHFQQKVFLKLWVKIEGKELDQ